MISPARILKFATACVALLAASAWLAPASAQECKADRVTVKGPDKIAFRKQAQLEGRGSAMRVAIAAWEKEVAAKFGEDWNQWDLAKDKDENCENTKEGVVANRVACTISARPCNIATASTPAEKKRRDAAVDDDVRPRRGLRDRRSDFGRRRYDDDRRWRRSRWDRRRYSDYRRDDDRDDYYWPEYRDYCSEAQFMLLECGYYVAYDGDCGPQTANALADFQWRNGLYPSGYPDHATRRALIRRCIR
jgi:hypothetical protein